jgi:DNA-nicking Smr family endonuclease
MRFMTKNGLSDADLRAWRAATRHVRPLGAGRSGTVPTSVTPISSPAPFAPAAGPRSSSRPVQDRGHERRVRRGKIAVSARIDLHGYSQDGAWRELPVFLARQRALGARCVMVITGKGRSGEGVLRRNFLRWLDLPEAQNLITGYAPAHARHGGGGAWYVFLRKV